MTAQKPIKLLVVEDEADIREMYSDLFKLEAGIQLKMTHDGAYAAGLLRSEAFDVAILDIRVPNMNGLQVASVARGSQLNRAIPIFIVTGSLDAESATRAKALKAVNVLEKPVDARALLKLVVDSCAPPKKAAGYDVRIINAILQAAAEVLTFYFAKEDVRFGKPGVRRGAGQTHSGVTGLIGLTGETFAGSLALGAQAAFLEGLGAKIFQTESVVLDQQMLADIMGELCNQLCGRVKAVFAGIGVKSNIGLPEVVLGNDHVVIHKVENPVLFVPIAVKNHSCELEFCLAERAGFVIDETKGEATVSGAVLF